MSREQQAGVFYEQLASVWPSSEGWGLGVDPQGWGVGALPQRGRMLFRLRILRNFHRVLRILRSFLKVLRILRNFHSIFAYFA